MKCSLKVIHEAIRIFSQGVALTASVKIDTTEAKENINAYPEIRPRRRQRVMRSEKY